MTDFQNDFPRDLIPGLDSHLAPRGCLLTLAHTAAGTEAQVFRGDVPSGVTIACVDGLVGVNRHRFDDEGDLAEVQLGLLRSPSDLAGILTDLDDRLAARPLGRPAGPVFPATNAILQRLAGESLAADVSERPDWDVPFEVDRIRLLDAAGEPTGVEVVVAENASWLRVDGEDGAPLDHEQADETADAAIEASRTSGLVMA